jgi:hypothetical protein
MGLYNLSKEYSIWISPSADLGSSGTLLFSGVFVAEEVAEVGQRRSGDTIMIDVETHLESFLNLFLRFACVIDEVFCGFGTTHLKYHVIRTSKLSDVRV